MEDFDDLNNILKVFRSWRDDHKKNPKLLHAHAMDQQGRTIQKTWPMETRFDSNRNILKLSQELKEYKDKGVFLTLTYNHTQSLKQTWESTAHDWHIFLTRLAKELQVRMSDLHYIYVLEAQGNGYPHIHALFLGIDYLFYAGNKKEWETDNPHSKNLKHFWGHGSVFVNATKHGQTVKNPVNYIMKYIRKTFGNSDKTDDKRELTQAMLWAFNKRSFNRSRHIFDFLKNQYKEPPNLHPKSKLELCYLDYYRVKMGTFKFSTSVARFVNALVKYRTKLASIAYPLEKPFPLTNPKTAIEPRGQFTPLLKPPQLRAVFDIHSFPFLLRVEPVPEPEFKPKFRLHGMGKFEKYRGQKTPLLWLEHKEAPETIGELEVYTIDDIDDLAERSGMMRATKEEQKALEFLIKAYNHGRHDLVYVAYYEFETDRPLSNSDRRKEYLIELVRHKQTGDG